MKNFLFPLILLVAVVLEVGGDVFFKLWADGDRRLMLILGFALYAAGSLFWAYSLKYHELSKAGTVFMVLNIVAIALIGTLAFKEKLSWMNIVGIVLGVAGIVLIEV